MFIHCAQCQTEFRPGLDRCPECDSDDIMVGMYTPSGMKVSAQRDATRMRLQARRFKGRTRYEFPTGAPPLSGAAREANVAPYLKMYNDVVWNHDRHRMERRVIHVDSDNDYYKQECSVWKPASALTSKRAS